ncbi:DUF4192 domain-containing protein [Streptomyces formicae]|uniref:DUF4192 domain-containing protein n=1 Tax=Streptomyces formicae TaxID=1616117 RepID=A0ABY3WPG8_9ACTN|nr:DUF4192 domain-containing protein [Streptomyces formicae]UNM11708.1 DUF4192 domain-containing protein [Streptomyces formicae]
MRDSNEHNESPETHESRGWADEPPGWYDEQCEQTSPAHGQQRPADTGGHRGAGQTGTGGGTDGRTGRSGEARDRDEVSHERPDEAHERAGEARSREDAAVACDRADEPSITLRGPAELVDALPYLMGFHPTDSVVMVALHGPRGRFGGRLRVGIPASQREWLPVAEQLAECLVEAGERRGARPDGIVVFLCQDPVEGETGLTVMNRLRPLAQRLRTACGSLDVPVYEALCISDGRFWSYCCPDSRCCPAEGTVMAMHGTSVMAAAAAYAGIQVRGTLREMEARLEPLGAPVAAGQQQALDGAATRLVHRILDQGSREQVGAETLRLAQRLMKRLGERATLGVGRTEADAKDDKLISHDEAAAVILGLQDRDTRDRAAAWMEGPDAGQALRLWRALARRCVGSYAEHAAAPLALAGWVSWSTGDEPGARVALSLALRADPEYVFARLLHQACNDGLDPEELRRCLRREQAAWKAEGAEAGQDARAEHAIGAGPGAAIGATAGGGSGGGSAPRLPRSPRAGRPTGKAGSRRGTSGAAAPGAGLASRRRPEPGTGTAAARGRSRTTDRGGQRGTGSGR